MQPHVIRTAATDSCYKTYFRCSNIFFSECNFHLYNEESPENYSYMVIHKYIFAYKTIAGTHLLCQLFHDVIWQYTSLYLSISKVHIIHLTVFKIILVSPTPSAGKKVVVIYYVVERYLSTLKNSSYLFEKRDYSNLWLKKLPRLIFASCGWYSLNI